MNPPQKPPKSAAGERHVAEDLAGQRLDNFLLASLKGVPRSHVYRLIRSGQVRVNSGRVGPSYRLQAGDRVRIPPVATTTAAPRKIKGGSFDWLRARIVHEDARIIVLDKPAGLAAHGGSGVSLGAIEALRAMRGGGDSLELAHRLDRATSGCLLIAKRRSALRMLHALLREGGVDKRYLALVAGRWPQGATRIEAPLSTDRRAGEARVRVDAAGKLAVSTFRLIESIGRFASFVEVELGTGRTHQIRVHAAHAGHPLAGDDRYGEPDFNARLEAAGLGRMFLHAHSVAFVWPDNGEELSVSVPLPEELAAVLTAVEERQGARPKAGRTPPP